MDEKPEGDRAGATPEPVELPPTRKHDVPDAPLPATPAPMTYPDDGQLAVMIRKVDHYLGVVEQAFVVFLLALVVGVAALAAIYNKIAEKIEIEPLGRWWHYIVRGGTFSIAMFAAVFATQQQRHLAMDLISRRLSARGRLILGVVLKVLTIAIASLLFRSGLAQIDVAGGNDGLDLFGLRINDADIVRTISIGAAMIILHSLLHVAIDIEYLVRGKLPPERARSGH